MAKVLTSPATSSEDVEESIATHGAYDPAAQLATCAVASRQRDAIDEFTVWVTFDPDISDEEVERFLASPQPEFVQTVVAQQERKDADDLKATTAFALAEVRARRCAPRYIARMRSVAPRMLVAGRRRPRARRAASRRASPGREPADPEPPALALGARS